MRRRPVQAFLVGAIVGGLLMSIADSDIGAKIPIPVYWILVPGLLLTSPILLLSGGVHGSLAGPIFMIVPIANGLVYTLLDRLVRRRRSKS
jgi:hypothetical protein